MKEVLLLLVVLLTSACAGQPLLALPDEAAKRLENAITNGDREALEQLIADDFYWVRSSGETGDKRAFINALTGDALDISPFTARNIRWYENGDIAVQSGINRLEGSFNGKPFVDQHHFADIWQRRDGVWRFVYAQVTALKSNER